MRCIEILEFDGNEYRKGDIVSVRVVGKEPIVGKLTDFCNSDLDLDCSKRFESINTRFTSSQIVTIERVEENEEILEQPREE
jgi:hypothetical protein